MKTICFVSGKGGVGKTTLACNAAFGLADDGHKVLLLDANFGLSNVELLLGIDIPTTLAHIIRDKRELKDALVSQEYPFDFIAGGTGMSELFNLTHDQIKLLLDCAKALAKDYDYLLIDVGSGMGSQVQSVLETSDSAVLVTTPEVTSLTDTYSMVQMIHEKRPDIELTFVVNRVQNEAHGKKVSENLKTILGQFLNLEVAYLGAVRFDKTIETSVHGGQLATRFFEKSPASVDMFDFAYSLARGNVIEIHETSFLDQLKAKFSKSSDDKDSDSEAA